MINRTLSPAQVDADEPLTELARFFTVAADSTQMCPMFSPCIDQAWHTLLVTSDSYAQFSHEACGRVLSHQPSLRNGRIPWVSDYEARFGQLPPSWFADETGKVDQAAYATCRATGEVFHSWDCSPAGDDDE